MFEVQAYHKKIRYEQARELLSAPAGSRPSIIGVSNGVANSIRSVYYLENRVYDALYISSANLSNFISAL